MRDKVARKTLEKLAGQLGFDVTPDGDLTYQWDPADNCVAMRLAALGHRLRGIRLPNDLRSSAAACSGEVSARTTSQSITAGGVVSAKEVDAKVEALAARLGLRFVPIETSSLGVGPVERGYMMAPRPMDPDGAVAKAVDEFGASENGTVAKVARRVADLVAGREPLKAS